MSLIEKLRDKYVKMPITAKAAFVFLLVNLCQKGLAFITSPIFVRLMSSEQYGIVSVYFTDEQLIGTIANFCLAYGCFDVGMQDYKNDRKTFLFSILVLSNIITIITCLIMGISCPLWSGYIQFPMYLFCVMFINFLLSPSFIFWTRAKRYEYSYRLPAIITIISSIVSSIISVICVYYFEEAKVDARIISSVFPMIPIYIFFWIYLAKKAKFKIKWEYLKFAFLFNLPLIPHYLSSFVLNSSDRLMIANLVGTSQAAYYSLAYNIAAIVTLLWSAINSSLVPFIFDKYEKKDYKTVSDHALPVLTMYAIICLLIILMAPEVIGILGTDEYYESIYVIPPVVGGLFFEALYYLFTNVLYYYKKPQIVMIASISTGLLNIILNYIFIQSYGYIAAGYTTLICFMLQAMIDYLVSKKVVGQNVYNMKYIYSLSFGVVIVSLLSNLFYSFPILRWVVICFIALGIYWKRDVIISLKNVGGIRQ